MTAYTHTLPSGSFTDLLRAAASFRAEPVRTVPAAAQPSTETVEAKPLVGGSAADLTRLATMGDGVEAVDMPDGGRKKEAKDNV